MTMDHRPSARADGVVPARTPRGKPVHAPGVRARLREPLPCVTRARGGLPPPGRESCTGVAVPDTHLTRLSPAEWSLLLRLQRLALRYFLDNQLAGGLVLDRQRNH